MFPAQNGDLFVNENVVQLPAVVDLDYTLSHLNAHVVSRFCAKRRLAIPKLLSFKNLYKYVTLQILNFILVS